MRKRLIITFRAGPTWKTGGVRDQPGWDAHAAFIDDLVEQGTMVMGGPFCDNSGSMILLEGVDRPQAERMIAADPFIENGVFVLDESREWDVFVDALTSSDPSGSETRARDAR